MDTTPERQTAAEIAAETPGSDNIGHLLWETTSRFLAFAEPHLSAAQLGPASTGALARIGVVPGITASELARDAFKTQQAISQVTGRLERLGYVERRVGRGRGVGLYLTQSGEQALAEGLAVEEALEQQARTLLGVELYAELKRCLREARDVIARTN